MDPGADFKNKKMALAGFGAEGQGAADFLLKAGAHITVFDTKPENDFPEGTVTDLRRRGAQFHFGALGPFEGFDFVVRSPGISPHVPELAAAAEEGIPFTSATKIFFDLCPCPIVGVTGTKGKGTTSSLLYQILVAGGKDAYLCGNIGAPALGFLEKLRPDSVVVYELSSFQLLELEKSPALAIVLMVTSEHLNFHNTNEEYLEAKTSIVRFQGANDRAIVNIDYPASRAMAALTAGEVFSVSRSEKVNPGAYVENGAIMLALDGEPKKIMDVSAVPLAGAHNLENICAAVLAASLLGVSEEVIVPAVRAFKALPHRLEFIREAGSVKYYDDSFSTTPESAIAALQSFDAPKIIVLGGSSKGADWSSLAAALAVEPSLKAIIGIGAEWPRMKKSIERSGGFHPKTKMIEGLKTMSEIVRAAAETAAPGDVVILSPACASFDMFRDYKDRGEQFAAAVRALP